VTEVRGGGLLRWLRSLGRAIARAAPTPARVDPDDNGTQLARQRTQLAVNRSVLAAERTLMAWIRTALSMISFGIAMVKFFEYLEVERNLTVGWFGRSWAPGTLGLMLITLGTGALVVAVIQHWYTLEVLRSAGVAPRWTLGLIVATFVAVFGIFAFGSLVLKY
jgi:putative membrane protein